MTVFQPEIITHVFQYIIRRLKACCLWRACVSLSLCSVLFIKKERVKGLTIFNMWSYIIPYICKTD